MRHLRERARPLDVFGLGGDRLQAQGARLLAHVSELAVVGLVEVLRHLRRLRAVFRAVLAEVDREPVALAVLVDYAGFNLRLARALHARGIPVVYYVSPQLWAWRRGRMRTVRDCVRHMVVIFPFEEPFYRAAGVRVTFVGHPLVELARPAPDPRGFLALQGLDPDRPVLAVLPGSRRQEIAHNLPPIAGALRLLQAQRPELQAALAVAPGIEPGGIRAALDGRLPSQTTGKTAIPLTPTSKILSSVSASMTASTLTAIRSVSSKSSRGRALKTKRRCRRIYRKYRYQIGLKRILQGIAQENIQREAEGKPLITRLAWTPGDVQADRYDLSKHLAEVTVNI